MMCRSSISLSHMVRLLNWPIQHGKRKENPDYCWYCCGSLSACWLWIGFYYYSRGQVADRYEAATYGKLIVMPQI